MLVVTRKLGESVQIGPDITVKVTLVKKDGSVRLGIEAPKDVEISHRQD